LGRWAFDKKSGWQKISETHIAADSVTRLKSASADAQELFEENNELKKELLALQKEKDDLMLENMELAEKVEKI
jgi:hypothetical protein